MSHDIATPESLDQLADDHTSAGLLISAATFRAMAKSWRATERALAEAQAENTMLQAVVNKARLEASRAEALSIQLHNTLAGGYKVLPAANAQQVAA